MTKSETAAEIPEPSGTKTAKVPLMSESRQERRQQK